MIHKVTYWKENIHLIIVLIKKIKYINYTNYFGCGILSSRKNIQTVL